MDGVAVADVGKVELAVEADKPAHEAEEEFCERRVDIEVVFTEDIVRGELAKVDLVETAIWTTSDDAPTKMSKRTRNNEQGQEKTRTRPGPGG